MKTYLWLVKREFWEHRGGFVWAPIWTGVAMLALLLLGLVAAEVSMYSHFGHTLKMGDTSTVVIEHGKVHISTENITIPTPAGPKQLAIMHKIVSAGLFGISGLISTVIAFVLFFYLLGALYDDRRDRSILFWRSLPISDTSTVLSKVITAGLAVPLLVIAIAIVTYFAMLVLLTPFVWFHGFNPFSLLFSLLWWNSAPLQVGLFFLVALPLNFLWALPTFGWLLLCSAAVRSKPFLWALLVPLVAGVLNGWFALLGLPHVTAESFWAKGVLHLLGGTYYGSAFAAAGLPTNMAIVIPGSSGMTLPSVIHNGTALRNAILHPLTSPVIGQAYLMPELWIGAALGIGMIALAIWQRRRAIET